MEKRLWSVSINDTRFGVYPGTDEADAFYSFCCRLGYTVLEMAERFNKTVDELNSMLIITEYHISKFHTLDC